MGRVSDSIEIRSPLVPVAPCASLGRKHQI